MITSAHNPKIQWVRDLQGHSRSRRQENAFVIEGVRLAEEALSAGWQARLVLCSDELTERGHKLLDGLAAQGAPVEQVTPQVLRAASDTETPPGILVVLAQRILALPARLDFVFIPDMLRDPGNLGAMLRTAAAAGIQAVFVPPGTVDVFAPKVLRAGMGAHFRLPIQPLDWEEISTHLQGLNVFLAAAGAGVPYTQADWRSPCALVIGGEAEGASQTARQAAFTPVHIPMPGGSESLNAAIAASILLYEAVRQRTAR